MFTVIKASPVPKPLGDLERLLLLLNETPRGNDWHLVLHVTNAKGDRSQGDAHNRRERRKEGRELREVVEWGVLQQQQCSRGSVIRAE
jgi:hypothetical protein